MDFFTSYIFIIFAVKILFISCSIINIYLKFKGKENSDLYKTLFYWKGRIEFIFVVLMSILLIYLFNPRKNKTTMINGETKLLLYLFGFVLLITADWSNFIEEANWFQRIQEVVGR
jgi:Ca2+/H+ antiporter